MYQPNAVFYVAMFIHACLFEAAAWYLLWYYGNTWSTWIISAVLFAISQMQHGWLQHDILHGSLFKSRKLNHLLHDINLGLLQVNVVGLNQNLCLTCCFSYTLYLLVTGGAYQLVGWKTL